MFRRWQMSGCLVTLLALIGCSEPQGDPATGPELGKGVSTSSVKPGGGSSTSCDFSSLHGFVVDYWPGPQQNFFDGLITSMEGTSDLSARQVIAYQVMDSIGVRSRFVSLSTSELLAGENLTKGLIKCSYDASSTYEFPGFPDSTLYDFHKALNAAAGGAYFVKLPTADSIPVLAKLGGTPYAGGTTYSGIAPPLVDLSATPDTSVNWSGILTESVLIYGWVESNPAGSHEWAAIRANTIFNPEAVVALCATPTDTNQVIFESNIGYLAWGGDGKYICDGTVTGTKSNLRSIHSPASFEDTDDIVLGVPIGPGKTQKVNVEFTILVSSKIGGIGNNGTCALLSGFNNSGQVATLLGQSNCNSPGFKQLARKTETTFLEFVNGNPVLCTPSSAKPNCKPFAGYATFKVTIPSPGAMSMTVTGVQTTADNNLDLDIIPTSIPRFNVKP